MVESDDDNIGEEARYLENQEVAAKDSGTPTEGQKDRCLLKNSPKYANKEAAPVDQAL